MLKCTFLNLQMKKPISKCRTVIVDCIGSYQTSHEPNFEVLGAPIGDPIFCAKVLAQRCAKAAKLLSQFVIVGSLDPQVALLLRQCAGYTVN